MREESEAGLRVWAVALVGVLIILGLTGTLGPGPGGGRDAGTVPVASVVHGDAGDELAATTYDGPMVRRRTAIAVHPEPGADREAIRRQLRAAAQTEHLGPLTDATFAVFSAQLLTYLVPEVTVVLPEGATPEDAEVLMKDHRYPQVAFYLVESVFVHDLTFMVTPGGVPPAEAKQRVDREGVLTDSLGRYPARVQGGSLTMSYFGAILSDGQIAAVRDSMARAAGVAPDQVLVAATEPGPGVDMSDHPELVQPTHRHG